MQILSDATLEKQWYAECKGMADRIIDMRESLVSGLAAAGACALPFPITRVEETVRASRLFPPDPAWPYSESGEVIRIKLPIEGSLMIPTTGIKRVYRWEC